MTSLTPSNSLRTETAKHCFARSQGKSYARVAGGGFKPFINFVLREVGDNSMNKNEKKGKFHVEPFLWFAIVLLFGLLVPLGCYDPSALYDNLRVLYDNILGKLVIFTILAFNLWHACHRIYHATHDFKFHPPLIVKLAIYGVAFGGSICVALMLV